MKRLEPALAAGRGTAAKLQATSWPGRNEVETERSGVDQHPRTETSWVPAPDMVRRSSSFRVSLRALRRLRLRRLIRACLRVLCPRISCGYSTSHRAFFWPLRESLQDLTVWILPLARGGLHSLHLPPYGVCISVAAPPGRPALADPSRAPQPQRCLRSQGSILESQRGPVGVACGGDPARVT